MKMQSTTRKRNPNGTFAPHRDKPMDRVQSKKEWNSKNYEKNKDKIKERVRIWKLNNPEKVKEYAKVPRAVELHRKRHKKYIQTPKGKISNVIRSQRYRAKLNNIIHDFTNKEWLDKLNSTDGVCSECKQHVGIDKLTLDHTIPISKVKIRHVYTINDVSPMCGKCNSSKGNKMGR